MKTLLLASCWLLLAALPAQVTYHQPAGHQQAGEQLVAKDVKIERLHTGMKFVEGPVWIARDSALVFSDIPRAKLLRWTEQGGVVDWRDSEQSNGNTLDLDGELLSAQHGGRNVIRHSLLDAKSVPAVLASTCDGKRFHSPNDLCVRNDGTIWFTDPTYGLGKRKAEAEGNFVYRLDETTGAVTIVQRDFAMPNGICFSPDHQRIYIADSGKKQRVGAFSIQKHGTLSPPLFWLDGGADGMRCDSRGNLYTTARDGVRIYSQAGEHLVTVKLPEKPANCAFGGPDGKQLFVTARTSLYRLNLRVSGAAIPALKVREKNPESAPGTKPGRDG
jgi:gluconolactonase